MTTSRTRTLRGARALLAAMVLAGGLAASGSASAAPGLPLAAAPHAEITPVQYRGDHEGWGHRRHHDGPRHGGWGHRHDGWSHRRHHGWDHHRGWGHRHHHHHHHHRGHGRYDY
ncbi:hypothetical protein [Methylobacterium sp. J-068]|uniref:hypothetical protein n=1 Tax=Methylobacterium sp. J-068 TaxID=2836649 RepID=UPI001FB91D48|nr:hypothetical protein [Methylobacterium sp. J-068]MCJ2035282.1 hypothetical protein [Methylobacterium sp. J-068]